MSVSALDCVKSCLTVERCVAAAYSSQSKTCDLLSPRLSSGLCSVSGRVLWVKEL